MIGIGLAVVGMGLAVLFRIFRKTRSGVRLAETLSQLRFIEIISVAFLSLGLFFALSAVFFAWIAFTFETAQVLAGLQEPRERSQSMETTTRAPEVNIPTWSIPDLPPTPTFTIPDFPTIPRPTPSLPQPPEDR